MTGNKPFTYGSVCSGIEAATVAWHPLGWSPSFFSEIDKFPRALLQHHYPHVPLHGDFTTIGENDYGAIDLLVGGTPCQAFSVAGLRKGFADERGNLTLEFVRLAQRKKPRWILWENVPGVLSIDRGRAFGSFLGGLAECGYGFAYRILDAQYFGVPQRRRRVFVVGYLGDWRPAAAVLFERESLLRDITPSREAREGVANCLSASPAANGSPNIANGQGNIVAATVSAKWSKGTGGYSGQNETENLLTWPANVAPTLDANYGDKMGQENQHINGGAGLFVPHVAIPIHDKATRYKGGGRAGDDGSSNGLGIGHPGDPMPTLDTGCSHAVAFGGEIVRSLSARHDSSPCADRRQDLVFRKMQVRRLTPRECERLQGFPDDYTLVPYGNVLKKKLDSDYLKYLLRGNPKHLSREDIQCLAADGNRYKALGNSMAVPVMRWLGKRINKVEKLI